MRDLAEWVIVSGDPTYARCWQDQTGGTRTKLVNSHLLVSPFINALKY